MGDHHIIADEVDDVRQDVFPARFARNHVLSDAVNPYVERVEVINLLGRSHQPAAFGNWDTVTNPDEADRARRAAIKVCGLKVDGYVVEHLETGSAFTSCPNFGGNSASAGLPSASGMI